MADLWGPEARERARAENAERKRKSNVMGMARPQRVIDMAGERVGRLTVVRRAPTIVRARWRCVCSCGNELVVDSSTLRRAQALGTDYACETCKPRPVQL
jgi:hypothetical protein